MIVALCQASKFSTLSWWEQVAFQLDDDDVCFVPDQLCLVGYL